ncbi:carbonate dehydratase [Jimgerdemannia flammicorona]|uniref:Carbonic anhydrase n=2 Tax=Jimgerdemannia flammicorona TaxID=994334 RepID=A0A433QLU3_9FUNG|nr:carbonate dehydratase [Jimgerdemannia flammicorona]RUS30737.1 carbonate dehydratase [Jimgerdemannia flammicorona]
MSSDLPTLQKFGLGAQPQSDAKIQVVTTVVEKQPRREDSTASYLSPSQLNKFDLNDVNLDSILENNRRWATTVREENSNFFTELSKKQEPKILWIGCSDSRVPANQLMQLGPGEVFVHRNIANVVSHTDLNCLSVVQYAVEVLKIEHIIVCGHYNCGGVSASMHKHQYGLIDSWLMNIKDVYRRHQGEFETIEGEHKRERRLVELNVLNSVHNLCHTTIVQNAWKQGQRLAVHGWVYELENGLINQLDICVRDTEKLEQVFRF